MSLIPLFYILKKNLSDLSLSLSRLSLSLTTLLFLQRRTINEIQSTPATTRRTLSSSSISDEWLGRRRDPCLCLRLLLSTMKSLNFLWIVASSLDDNKDKSRRIYHRYLLWRKHEATISNQKASFWEHKVLRFLWFYCFLDPRLFLIS